MRYYNHTHLNMLVYRVVLCIVVGCSKRSGRDKSIGVASGAAGPVLAGPLLARDHTHNYFHALSMLRII